MRVAGICQNTVQNGEGIRCVIFLSGCHHNCPGCQNPENQSMCAGEEMSVEEVFERIQDLKILRGITLSGGEPFLQPKAIKEIANKLKSLYSDKNLWCYTGFTIEQLKNMGQDVQDALDVVDVLVDGLYIEELNPKKHPDVQRLISKKDKLATWRNRYTGSTNQRVIEHINGEWRC